VSRLKNRYNPTEHAKVDKMDEKHALECLLLKSGIYMYVISQDFIVLMYDTKY